MESPVVTHRIVRFGTFEADLSSGLLTREGLRVKIEIQPFQVLTLLLTRPGEIITREELHQQLWPDGTYVDFDGSLNAALKKLRAALNDDPKKPRFIETVPRRGYRFVVPVSFADSSPERLGDRVAVPSTVPTTSVAAVASPRGRWSHRRTLALVAFALEAAVAVVLMAHKPAGPQAKAVQAVSRRPSIAVLGFRNISGKAGDAWLATALAEMLSTELAGGGQLRSVSGEDIANLRRSSPWPQSDSLNQQTANRLGTALDSEFLVLGSYAALQGPRRRQLRVDLRLQNARTGEILAEIGQIGDRQDLFQIVSSVGEKLRERMGVPPLEENEEVGVLASYPLDPEAARLYSLGLVKLRESDYLSARGLFEEAAKADPKFPLAYSMLSRADIYLGHDDQAKAEAKRGVDLAGSLPPTRRMEIEASFDQAIAEHGKAAALYRVLFNLYPDRLDYGFQLAQMQFEAFHPDEALETLRQLHTLPSPARDDPGLDLLEGRIQFRRDPQAADRLFHSSAAKALAQGKKLAYARAEQAICFMNRERVQAPPACQEAYEIFLAAGNLDETGNSLQLMAEANRLTGHDQEAVPLYERAERTFKEAGDRERAGVALNNLSLVLEDEGQWSRAEQSFGEARENFQAVNDRVNVGTATGNIADILVLRGHLRQAAEMYRQAWELEEAGGSGRQEYAHIQHAALLLMQGELQPAREEVEAQIGSLRAYGGDPWQLANALTVLGDIEKASGNLDGARSHYTEALDVFKKEHFPIAGPQVSLAELAIAEGRPDAAESQLRQPLAELEKEQSAGEEIGGYTSLARALLAQGKVPEARDAIARASQFADLHEFPVLVLPLEILQARAAAVSARPGARERSDLIAAAQKLRAALQEAHLLGAYSIECDARLALGEVETKVNSASGRAQLRALADETHRRGMDLVTRQAAALEQPGALSTKLASVR